MTSCEIGDPTVGCPGPGHPGICVPPLHDTGPLFSQHATVQGHTLYKVVDYILNGDYAEKLTINQ